MRGVLVLALLLLAVASALAAGASAMLARNVLDPEGFGTAVLGTIRSPAGRQLVRTSAENAVLDRFAASAPELARAAAPLVGTWAVRALNSPAAARVVAPAAVGLQQGILTGTQRGSVQFDVRAFATAAKPPPAVSALLAAAPGELLLDVPWVEVSPGAQTVLQELDRHRRLPMLLAGLAALAGLLALVLARRRSAVLIAMGVMLAAGAWLLRPLAADVAGAVVVRRSGPGAAAAPLAGVFVDRLFDGWGAIGWAFVAIGCALVLVGAAFALRRSS